MVRFRILAPYLIIILVWLVAVVSKLIFNGLVYGLDFGLYHPDGVHYTLRTLVWLGHNPTEAAQQVSNWYAIHSAKNVVIDPISILPENSPVWGLVNPRLLYPFLSLPFVSLFGVAGMLVVPVLSLLITMFAIYKLATSRLSTSSSLLLATSISLSPTILRWSVANLTDPLSMALFSFVPLLLVSKLNQRTQYLLIFLLILLTSVTRFCLPIWLAIAAFLFLSRKFRDFLFVTIVAFVASLQALLSGTSVGLLPSESSETSLQKMALLPISFFKVAVVEFGQLAVLDRFLLGILVLATISSLRNYRMESSQLFLLVALAVWLLGAINGVFGVNFRYQLPLIPFIYWVMINSNLAKRVDESISKKG